MDKHHAVSAGVVWDNAVLEVSLRGGGIGNGGLARGGDVFGGVPEVDEEGGVRWVAGDVVREVETRGLDAEVRPNLDILSRHDGGWVFGLLLGEDIGLLTGIYVDGGEAAMA